MRGMPIILSDDDEPTLRIDGASEVAKLFVPADGTAIRLAAENESNVVRLRPRGKTIGTA